MNLIEASIFITVSGLFAAILFIAAYKKERSFKSENNTEKE